MPSSCCGIASGSRGLLGKGVDECLAWLGVRSGTVNVSLQVFLSDGRQVRGSMVTTSFLKGRKSWGPEAMRKRKLLLLPHDQPGVNPILGDSTEPANSMYCVTQNMHLHASQHVR